MAKVTLDEEFNTLGGPWQPIYPWSPEGWPTGGSWLANPSVLPPDGNPISVANGVMTLRDFARPADVPASAAGGLDRIGGQVVTQNSFAQTYGYFEASIQMPAGIGEGGAFWLLPQGGGWPPELDIAEVYGNFPNLLINTLHDATAPPPLVNLVADTTQTYHTYAVDWEPNTITWYFDGRQTFQTATPADMNQPMYMVFSVNSGTTETLEGPAAPSLVSNMNIAWVHVYDTNPYTTGGALPVSAVPARAANPAPAPAAPAAAPPVDDHVVVNIGSATLAAPASPTTFLYNGTGHDTVINGFAATDVIDFEMTTKDFADLSVLPATDGHALIDFDGNHISLPGITPNDLTWSNFIVNGHSNTNPSL